MLKLFVGNRPDQSRKLQINIIRTLSKTDSMLSVLNRSSAAMFDLTYNINDSRTWFSPIMANNFSCSLLYPIVNPIRNIVRKYTILKNILA